VKKLLAIGFSIALLVWLAGNDRWADFLTTVSRITPSMLAVALAGLFLSYVLRALRVHDEFRLHARSRFGSCLRIVLIHNAMVNIVPFRGGEAAFPLLLRQTFGTPLGRAIASLFWFRLQDAFVVAILAVVIWPGLPTLVRIVGVAVLIATAWALPRWANAPHRHSQDYLPDSKVSRIREAFAESTRHARFGWLWTISNWSVKLAVQAWLLAQLLGTSAAVGGAGVLGAELASILPIQGVAGFGTYEAGAAAAMLPNGIALASGLQAALALHLVVIASALVAGAIAWLIPSVPPAQGPGRSETSSTTKQTS